MNNVPRWSKEAFESSVSSQCWTYTPYEPLWECPRMQGDEDLQRLLEQERALSPVPAWAREIVRRSINFPPFCPHASFPQPYLEVVDVIGRQTPPTIVHGCYTVSRERKERMQDYLFCLDAWLAGAQAPQAAEEMGARGSPKVNWQSLCADLWQVLGERTELKELLLRRILHRQRWWIKATIWDCDRRNTFGRDQYLGKVACDGGDGDYGNPGFRDPYFAELEAPEVKRMEDRLARACPDWAWFRNPIRDSWLCAPKAFRFLERLIWCVGKERRCVRLPSHPLEGGDSVPGFLQCEDTYPETAKAKEWVRAFVRGLRSWIVGGQPADSVARDVHARLGDPAAVKLWLAGLFLKKMELINPYGAAGLP